MKANLKAGILTPKQIERLKKKIADIRKALAAEKRKFGGYDDSRGLRYLPLQYYIRLEDPRGGLVYLRWFDKNFPDDIGFPDFLFERTLLLFSAGKTREAARQAFETFCANTYLFDKFFGRPVTPQDKWEGSNLETAAYTEYFDYACTQPEFAGFSAWLAQLTLSEDFIRRSEQYIRILRQLKTEHDQETRRYLVMQARQLRKSL